MKLNFNITEELLDASPRSIPAYTCKVASQYLDIPDKTIRAWFFGTTYKNGVFDPIFEPADEESSLLSFDNLAEAYVYRALRCEKLNPQKIKKALRAVSDMFGSKHPLIEHQFMTNGLDLFMEIGSDVRCISSDQEYFAFYSAWLSRVSWTDSKISRIYPNTRPNVANAPKLILFDPNIAFGRTVIESRFVPTKAIADRFLAGETIDDLKADYRCESIEIDEAIRIEWRYSKERKVA